MQIRVVNGTKKTELGNRIRLADTLLRRLRGFLFRSSPATGEGLLLTPCQSVHMVGVPFPLDVLFIDADGHVVGLHHGLAPMRWTRFHRTASHALELPEGTIARTRTELGDGLLWTPVADEADIVELPPSEEMHDQRRRRQA